MASIAALSPNARSLTTHFCKLENNSYSFANTSCLTTKTHGGDHDLNPRCNLSIVRASGRRTSPRNVDLVNGKKVNGVHVVGEAPLFSGGAPLLAEESGIDGEKPLHDCLLGRFVEDKFVYGQTFIIRSYEIGPDKTATMETLMNLLQVCLLKAYGWIIH